MRYRFTYYCIAIILAAVLTVIFSSIVRSARYIRQFIAGIAQLIERNLARLRWVWPRFALANEVVIGTKPSTGSIPKPDRFLHCIDNTLTVVTMV